MKRLFAFVLLFALLLGLAAPASASGSHSVAAGSAPGGTLTLSAASARAGDTVTGSVSPAAGYDIATVRVERGGSYTFAALTGLDFSFTMPDGDVTVIPAFFSTKVWDGAVDVSWYDPEAAVYYLGEPAELAGLAAIVNGMVDIHTPDYLIKGDSSVISCTAYDNVMLVGAGGGNVSDRVYCSDTDFAYKTVYLTADLDMGGVQAPDGTWSGPNWTPIGGKFSMDPEEVAGDSYVLDTRFNGVLDGQGHTVTHISCHRYAAKGFPYSMAIGLVGYLGGGGDVSGISAELENGWRPGVRNVTVGPGYIYGRRMVAGVVGRIGNASGGVVVENCANFADVLNTDAKGVGGIVGAGWGTGVIRNCYNAGNISTVYACPAGGICASNDGLDIYNCYNIGTINSNGAVRGRAIGGHDSGTYSVLNCYYLAGCDDDPASGGWYTGTAGSRLTIDITALSEGELKSESFLRRLNGNGTAFTADTRGINGGYPVLWYQAAAPEGEYRLSVTQPEGGTVGHDGGETVPAGTLVQLTAEAKAGYTLRRFTVNGSPITGDFWTVTGDCVFSAEFSPIRTVTLTVAESEDYALSVKRTGYRMEGDALVWVENEPLRSGDALLQENLLTVSARGYDDLAPADMDLEFTDAFTLTVTGAQRLRAGEYTVSGEENVTVSALRGTQKKTWLTLADTSWYDRGGHYSLTTAAQLAGLAYLVNSGESDFAGETVTLGADISLKNTDGTVGVRTWKGIGVSPERSFAGTFDGAGHRVTEMTAWSDGSYAALFGYAKGATLRNLAVFGVSSCEGVTAYSAGLCAYADGCTVENCDSRVAVSVAGSTAGGLTAYTAGGTLLQNCRNYGAVTAECSVGGITAVCYGAEDLITGCYNFGVLTATGSGSSGTGGIAGKLTGAMENCGNTGDIQSADRYTGGLAGYTVGRSSSRISESVNAGSLSVTSSAANAAAGLLVGYAQYLTMENCRATGSVAASPAFPGDNKGSLVGKRGEEAKITACAEGSGDSDFGYVEIVLPPEEQRDSYTATFVADGAVVARVSYRAGDSALAEPEVPAKAGYEARWDRYSLGAADIIVRAVYRLREASAGDTLTDGAYALRYGAAGELNIAPGSSVTLSGTGEGLTVRVGRGASLTLDGVTLSGEQTLLSFEEGGRLILSGDNTLAGLSDERGNGDPSLFFDGTLTVTGGGSLRIGARIGNAAVYAEGGSLTLAEGLVSVEKLDLLGFEGGAVTLGAGSLTVSGGSLLVYTDSDNVSAVSAASVTLAGGSLNARCLHAETVVDAALILSGGSARLEGHSPNSSGGSAVTVNGAAAKSVSGSGFLTVPNALDAVMRTNQTIRFMGEAVTLEVYNIGGDNYFKLRDLAALLSSTGSSFSVDFDPNVYAVTARSRAAYTFVGGEREPGEDQSVAAVPSRWLFYADGTLRPCASANIGGNNFFKLRDLGDALGFRVDYDYDTRTVIIEP